jgi:hypothetical protein
MNGITSVCKEGRTTYQHHQSPAGGTRNAQRQSLSSGTRNVRTPQMGGGTAHLRDPTVQETLKHTYKLVFSESIVLGLLYVVNCYSDGQDSSVL